MTTKPNNAVSPERPDFMITLGLLPPYAQEDVRMAYREKSKTMHPDRGGSAAEFQRLHEAYEQAMEYVKFRTGRRQWLANQVERYIRQEEVTDEVRRRGGQVEVEQIDWMKRSFGDDFAQVTDRLRGIRVRGQSDGDAFLTFLAARKTSLEFLVWLDLADCRISDEGLRQLRVTPGLKRLNLAGTPVTKRGLRVLNHLPQLERLNLRGTRVGWLARWRLQWTFPRLTVVTESTE